MGKYATVELNKVASRKTGEIEAQCKLAAAVVDSDNKRALENGAIVYVDAKNDEIVKTWNATNCVDAIYLHFSNPRRYEDGKSGMENFRYEPNDDYVTFGDKYLPRVYKLTAGDIFTTDYNLSATVGTMLTFGNHKVMPVKNTTMPNGKAGIMYRVVA